MKVCNLLMLVVLLRASYEGVYGSNVCESFCIGVPSGTVLMNPINRHSYYVCINNEARQFDCGNNQIYDPNTLMCVRDNTSGDICHCDGSNDITTTCAPVIPTQPTNRPQIPTTTCAPVTQTQPTNRPQIPTTTCAPVTITGTQKPCTAVPNTPWTPCDHNHGHETTTCVTIPTPCNPNHDTTTCASKAVVVRGYLRSRRDCRNENDGVIFLSMRNRNVRRTRTTRYYVCNGGRVTNQDCQANYWFDQTELRCITA